MILGKVPNQQKREQRSKYPSEQFCQTEIFFNKKKVFFSSLFDIFRILIDVSDPPSPTVSITVRPSDFSSSHFPHFDTYCRINIIIFSQSLTIDRFQSDNQQPKRRNVYICQLTSLNTEQLSGHRAIMSLSLGHRHHCVIFLLHRCCVIFIVSS